MQRREEFVCLFCRKIPFDLLVQGFSPLRDVGRRNTRKEVSILSPRYVAAGGRREYLLQ
jgi:hypothetical protein